MFGIKTRVVRYFRATSALRQNCRILRDLYRDLTSVPSEGAAAAS